EQEIRDLEKAWRSTERISIPLNHDDWTFSHIYPNNSPVRRIIAMSHILERHGHGIRAEPAGRRLLVGLMNLVSEASLPGGHHTLENGLTVTASGYWQDHFDLGVGSRTRTSALLGASKAGEIATNVLLPFAFALAKVEKDRELMDKALALYRSYRRLASNEITRHMTAQLGLEPASGVGACHQQGLIHIFRNYCREGKCPECPLAAELDFRGVRR
ncbi:MAG: DUF2851 family protein, partial [Dehalococcoidia bacterium]